MNQPITFFESHTEEEIFVVDGPGGGRIVKLSVWHQKAEGFLVALEFEMNHGRKHTVSRQDTVGPKYKVCQSVAGGKTLVGFWATMTTQRGFWRVHACLPLVPLPITRIWVE